MEKNNIDALAHYLHQDNLVWNAFAWAIPIEAGIIAGGFAKPGWPGLSVVVFGTVLVFLLMCYAWKAAQDRDVNKGLIETEGFKPEAKSPWFLSGKGILILGFTWVMIANAFQIYLHLCKIFGWCAGLTKEFFPN